jgi:hypothetical protein
MTRRDEWPLGSSATARNAELTSGPSVDDSMNNALTASFAVGLVFFLGRSHGSHASLHLSFDGKGSGSGWYS